MRVFISVDIPENVKREIKKIQDSLPEFRENHRFSGSSKFKDNKNFEVIGKKTELENLHLTLKFLGEIDEKELEQVKERFKGIKFREFEAEIDSIGVFSEKFIRIIWLHIKSCQELQKRIDEALKDLFQEEKRFMSHLTIARVKNIKNKQEFLKELGKIKINKIKFKVDNFRLKKSTLTPEGPIYEALEEYALA